MSRSAHLWLAGLGALAGCFTPTYPSRPCGPDGACPDGQACDLVQGLCVPEANACTERPCWETVLDVPAAPYRDIDILFVISTSGGMSEEQTSLVANFQRFVDVLATMEGGLPDVNIGVITQNVGAGPYPISGCGELGDNGLLQSTRGDRAPAGCTGPSGAFIQDWSDGFGGRIRNYDGAQGLAATFGCIALRGNAGCGFEQPLESMRRALNGSVAANAEFNARPDSLLAIVFVSDEDDCSAFDITMFDTSSTDVNDPLGPLGDFRCFEFGVDCATGNDDPRALGERMDCGPRAGSPYMVHPDDYIDFLRLLKGDDRLFVAGILGDSTPVIVTPHPETNNPVLAASCVSASGAASPAIRVGYFVDAFAPASSFSTICNEDLSDALILSAGAILRAAGHPCLEADIDLDPIADGVQSQCEVTEAGAPLAECNADHTNLPCWYFYTDYAMCPTTMLRVDRGGATPPADARLRLRCLVP